MTTTYEVHALYNDGSTIRNTDITSASFAEHLYRDYLPKRELSSIELIKRDGDDTETVRTWSAMTSEGDER